MTWQWQTAMVQEHFLWVKTQLIIDLARFVDDLLVILKSIVKHRNAIMVKLSRESAFRNGIECLCKIEIDAINHFSVWSYVGTFFKVNIWLFKIVLTFSTYSFNIFGRISSDPLYSNCLLYHIFILHSFHLGESNNHYLFVASQDAKLRVELRKIPGI